MSNTIIKRVLARNDEATDRPKAERIGPVGQAVMLVLANYANDDGVTMVGLGRLAREACCNRRTAVRTLQRLQKLNRISRVYQHDAHGLVEGAITTILGGTAPPRGTAPPGGDDDAPRGQTVLPLGAERPPNPKRTLRQPRKKKEGHAKRATRLDPDASISDAQMAFAISKGLTPERARDEWAKMVDWSQSSPKGASLNWDSSWRNWIRRVVRDSGNAPPRKRNPVIDEINKRLGKGNGA